jgi:hypothetical protein
MPLPTVQLRPESFGANDTTYIRLTPNWDATTIGLDEEHPFTPVDIAIGEDEYIFVADSLNNRIITLQKSGEQVTAYNLGKIGPVPHPTGVAIDEKLNLLIVNETNQVFVWNQFFNYAGIDLSGDQAGRDSLYDLNVFYTDPDPQAQFHGIAFGPENENSVFITDKRNNRILQLRIQGVEAIQLQSGYPHPRFAGFYEKDIAQYGSGAGTVDNPRGITADDDGYVYITQLGGNFLVQKLESNGVLYKSVYTLYQDPIMDLGRFSGPSDIALGQEDAIFVLDRAAGGEVLKFHNRGAFAGHPADLGNEGLVDARFESPASIAVSREEIVYVANTAANQIERFKYSVSEDDLPDEDR